MSVRKSCLNCAHEMDCVCVYGLYEILKDPNDCPQWSLSRKNKADVLHDAAPEHDAVSHPSHYTTGGIECIDCIKAALGENFMGFLIGNVVKYTYRYKHKNGVQDLEKARWYLDRAIKELTENVEKR